MKVCEVARLLHRMSRFIRLKEIVEPLIMICEMTASSAITNLMGEKY